jgi:hypothetical protein
MAGLTVMDRIVHIMMLYFVDAGMVPTFDNNRIPDQDAILFFTVAFNG